MLELTICNDLFFQSVLFWLISENELLEFENNCQNHDVTDSQLLVSRVVKTSSEIQCTFSHFNTLSFSKKFYIQQIEYLLKHHCI